VKCVTTRNTTYIWCGLVLLALCCAGALALNRWLYACLGGFLCLVFLVCGSERISVSDRGIEIAFLRWRTLYSWDQVIQAGIMDITYHGACGPHLLVTLEGGKPKTPGQGFADWFESNPKGLKIPCVEGLRELVKVFYGPLDFDIPCRQQ